jgi:hypothetical protein
MGWVGGGVEEPLCITELLLDISSKSLLMRPGLGHDGYGHTWILGSLKGDGGREVEGLSVGLDKGSPGHN